MPISSTEEIIDAFRTGQMVVLVDDEDRENEGDLILAADFVTPQAINFMVTHARGLVCLTLTKERCRQLGLELMTRDNGGKFNTAFTLSIEAAKGVSTGISAHDRAKTVQAAVAPDAHPEDIVQPGHIFPIMARPGGVLMRAGHTEAGCDLAELAGLTPASVICEVLNEDGSMARLPDLLLFAEKHGIRVGTIADLIRYRSQHESIIERMGERSLNTPFGTFQSVAYRDKPGGSAHLALFHGKIEADRETFVRVHQPVSLIDLMETETISHSWDMVSAMKMLATTHGGVMVLLNCEASAEDVFFRFNQIDTTDISSAVHAGSNDLRTYGIGAQILRDLGVGKMRLLGNPRKMPSMTGFNLDVTGYLEKSDGR
ncbi:bifunctional 3,4-dihydroxy-2-butanone-4-phosphate synthase/GTP cyclohydrolase II [Oxalobacter vibrioformis]|uniref:3,4-dihydroxy-2-butanone 4-phosphate synthase n=1 Tax=Oxalobacter vibrioformis TaxID=933080 RepID=A0A9E9LWS8_9BURK|nr:bifunctional 3,4-dihydroxy-2-butanone-4-phosphate synthase/GTP cyclohydrolase II [Oxalobacter vibrioformis]WAW11195.1 bifunctional 3,4-dihydroxy-2-butanone-4-phosphate synthase/GTP cyclohydrolase II [Oxalobacter vibrioformis]